MSRLKLKLRFKSDITNAQHWEISGYDEGRTLSEPLRLLPESLI
jgi:hypothetical protein